MPKKTSAERSVISRNARKIEVLVADLLGLKRQPLSGGSWFAKEDAKSGEYICQIKSTSRNGYRIKKQDLHDLMKNSRLTHTKPLFVVVFVDENGDADNDYIWVAQPIKRFKPRRSSSG